MRLSSEDHQFLDFAHRVGKTLLRSQGKETALRLAGDHHGANALYFQSKAAARVLLEKRGITPKEFDRRLKALSPRRRMMQLERLFA